MPTSHHRTPPPEPGPRRVRRGPTAQRHLRVAGALLLVLLASHGCRKEKQQPAPAVPSNELLQGVRVRHILIQYVGAQGAGARVTRSKPAADSLARALRVRIGQGENFSVLAREYSDDASADEGGEVAPIQPGEVPPEFERAATALQPGQMSEVFETPYGFHVVQRIDGEAVACQHILIRFRGVRAAPDTLRRSRAQALEHAQKILAELRNPLTSFPVAAAKYSEDELTASRGGYLGVFGRGHMVQPFETAAFALKVGEISGIVETPFGFHIIRRVDPKPVRVSHILITYAGSDEIHAVKTRGRDEALQIALDALFRARKGEDFAALAGEYSEDRLTAGKGGKLPPIDRGQTVPEFEEVAFSLEPGQISDVVETKFGFHVIKRLH
jgi:peptidyl-prolyl cis-trans isomerase SurA